MENTIMDSFEKYPDAELVPALKVYLQEVGRLGPVLRHPLVYAVPYFPTLNHHYNQQLKLRRQQFEEKAREQDWWSMLSITERPYRVQIFDQYKKKMSSTDYWEILSWMWTDSENIWQNKALWRKLLRAKVPGRENFMTLEERKFLSSLPDKVLVYRGYQPGKNMDGLSYTLEQHRAVWHAKRFKKGGEVMERMVDKKKIFAYQSGRSEQEIIIL